ncbi:hypothetical protein K8353_39045 [Burkholderia contaminans]|nr:hypothetical protein [Burkholderia contaminans]
MKNNGSRVEAVGYFGCVFLALVLSIFNIESAGASQNKIPEGYMNIGQGANQTGVIPDGRVKWIKSPLITRIEFRDAILRGDSVKLLYYLSYINRENVDIKWTGMPMPDGPAMRLYQGGKEILPAPLKRSGISPYVAGPRDEEIRLYRNVVKAHDTWVTDGAAEYVVLNGQFLPGTHIYEIVYWQTQLDWIDVREYLERTDSQGKGRMMYPITDNAPSNRLYFKIYKPTEEEARQGRHIEFLGEVDAKTQGPQFPFARPGDFAPRTGYWQAVGKSIDAIGGYHETFVKEGDSMPNLPGKVGVDPFGFQWKFVGERSAVPCE